MRLDYRLARMLHVLIHIYGRQGAATSEDIARMLKTNPVVVRRTMSGLRNAGYVRSTQGRGGGWEIIVDLKKVSVLDIYQALDRPAIYAMGAADDHPDCPVERAVTSVLDRTFMNAEKALLEEFGKLMLSDFIPVSNLRAGSSYN
ncbi:Rrf2 family transcriptional regulator [Undibacterium sp. Ji42W]|uniref:Rrf2 family transcriptional regulator n=1 Tax=Undibacterium sp. Ji42W TaxID=3413039 RepID=UPI003BF3A597